MKRTTIYLDPELELQLKAEARRLGLPMAEVIRDALRRRVAEVTPSRSPHAGAFVSGHTDTADRIDELLRETGFGGDG
jgi:hypothetical protein